MAQDNGVGNLFVSLNLDTSGFTDSIKDINRRMQIVKNDFASASDGTKEYARSLEGLEAKQRMLTAQMDLQGKAVSNIRQRYEALQAAGKGNTEEAKKLAAQLSRSQAEYRRYETQLGMVTRAIEEQSSVTAQAE